MAGNGALGQVRNRCPHVVSTVGWTDGQGTPSEEVVQADTVPLDSLTRTDIKLQRERALGPINLFEVRNASILHGQTGAPRMLARGHRKRRDNDDNHQAHDQQLILGLPSHIPALTNDYSRTSLTASAVVTARSNTRPTTARREPCVHALRAHRVCHPRTEPCTCS